LGARGGIGWLFLDDDVEDDEVAGFKACSENRDIEGVENVAIAEV